MKELKQQENAQVISILGGISPMIITILASFIFADNDKGFAMFIIISLLLVVWALSFYISCFKE